MSYQLYPSDLTDREWDYIKPLIPPAKPGGRHRVTDMRLTLNALFYLTRTGCAWRYLPREYPPWQTVYGYFRSWRVDGTWQRLHDRLRARVRFWRRWLTPLADCARFGQMPSMPGTWCSGSGTCARALALTWKSSNEHPARKALQCCRGDGWLSGPSLG